MKAGLKHLERGREAIKKRNVGAAEDGLAPQGIQICLKKKRAGGLGVQGSGSRVLKEPLEFKVQGSGCEEQGWNLGRGG